MRVLLIGGSGQLGHALASAFANSNDLLATAYLHVQPGEVVLDMSDASATKALLESWCPELVLVSGAMCHVDRCEREPEQCRRVNVDAPALVADYARQHGGRVVFFSTDHVFDGEQSSYNESDVVNPLSVYAQSKLEAENVIRETIPENHLIIRTGWVYGPDFQRRNFILRLVDRLQAGEKVAVPVDQWGRPTYTDDLASVTRILVGQGAIGTFHATGPELIDRMSLARRVCDRFDLDINQVLPRPTAALGQVAQRSLRVLLDCSKLHGTGVPAFRGIASGLEALAAWSESTRSCQEAS